MNKLLPDQGTVAFGMYMYVLHSPRPVFYEDLVAFGFNCKELFKKRRDEEVSYGEVAAQVRDFTSTVGVGELIEKVFDPAKDGFVTKKKYYIPPMTLDERIKLKDSLDYFDSMD